MSGRLPGIAAAALVPEALASLPESKRCIELGFARAAIERGDGAYQVGELLLRVTPAEAAALALAIEDVVGAVAMQEARRLRAHGPAGNDTEVLLRVRDALRVA